MDVQRNRTSLEELRQVAEDELDNRIDIDLKRTKCLGVCKPGHVMGLADADSGVYLFNNMASEEDVRDLVEFSVDSLEADQPDMSERLKTRLEKRFNTGAIQEIPWH